MAPPGATLITMTATASAPTMAPADLVIGLRERVRLSETQIARGTGTDENTVRGWLERREPPDGVRGQRLTELVAFIEEMARNLRGETLAGSWLDGNVDFLGGANPLDEIAAGRYESMMQYALGLSYGAFT
jgi:DNA-binding transcriptional regulator YiaG